MTQLKPGVTVALACGGTGGHLFPGLAVAQELAERGARLVLFVSPKEVDQQGLAASRHRFTVVTLPQVALTRRGFVGFLRGTWQGYRQAVREFKSVRPAAVLAMGGFTAAAPVLAGRRVGARIFLHESNAVPGRANVWLGRLADLGFAGMTDAVAQWRVRRVCVTGTPVRPEIRSAEQGASRRAQGLAEDRPVLLVTGGSQGAHGVNQLFLACLPELAQTFPGLQLVHLTGSADFKEVSETYRRAGIPALIRPFSNQMDQLLAAATVVVSRSGASSLAELAARRLPSVLIPFPSAAGDHQRRNAEVFVRIGAARMVDQTVSDGAALGRSLTELLESETTREEMATALARLDRPQAAAEIAELICRQLGERLGTESSVSMPATGRALVGGRAG